MRCSPQHGVLIACKVRLWGRIFEHLLGLPIHRRDSPHSSRARIVTSGGAPDTYLMTAYAPYSTTLRIANCATSSSIHSHIRAHRDGDRCQAAPALDPLQLLCTLWRSGPILAVTYDASCQSLHLLRDQTGLHYSMETAPVPITQPLSRRKCPTSPCGSGQTKPPNTT